MQGGGAEQPASDCLASHEEQKHSEMDVVAAHNLLAYEVVEHQLVCRIGSMTPTELANGFLKAALTRTTDDYQRLKKTLRSTPPPQPKQLLNTTLCQACLDQLPSEWDGTKLYCRKGKWKGKWMLTRSRPTKMGSYQWFLYDGHTAAKRYIPSLEQVFCMLNFPHPKTKTPLHRSSQKEVYSFLKADTHWLTPSKRVVMLTLRHLRNAQKVVGEDGELQNATLKATGIPAMLPPTTGIAQDPVSHRWECPREPPRNRQYWQPMLRRKWTQSRPTESYAPLSKRLKMLAKLIIESKQGLNTPPVDTSLYGIHNALVKNYGLTFVNVTKPLPVEDCTQASATRQVWLALMLVEDPCLLPPPLDVVAESRHELLGAVQNEEVLRNVLLRNSLMNVQCMDFESIWELCASTARAMDETNDSLQKPANRFPEEGEEAVKVKWVTMHEEARAYFETLNRRKGNNAAYEDSAT
eukprot:scaffold245_cov341-Pavlova_lutheri.AAC.3